MKQSNWLTFLINGIIALIIGSLLLFVPVETVLTLVRYLGILILVAGIVLLIVAIRNIRSEEPYTMLMAEALAAVIIGALLLFYTQKSIEMFVILIGVWALIIGIVQVIISVKFREKLANHSLLLINGLLTAMLGILLFFNPFATVVILSYIVGLLALAVGVLLIYFSLLIKKIV